MATSSTTFPVTLHRLLSESEKNGDEDIVSWLPGGESFKVHDVKRFEAEIMSKYFGTSNYRSFQKNLSMWSYTTTRGGSNRGCVYHPLFVRTLECLCYRMVRRRSFLKKTKNAAPSGAAEDIKKKTKTNHHDDGTGDEKTLHASKESSLSSPFHHSLPSPTTASARSHDRCADLSAQPLIQGSRVASSSRTMPPALTYSPTDDTTKQRKESLASVRGQERSFPLAAACTIAMAIATNNGLQERASVSPPGAHCFSLHEGSRNKTEDMVLRAALSRASNDALTKPGPTILGGIENHGVLDTHRGDAATVSAATVHPLHYIRNNAIGMFLPTGRTFAPEWPRTTTTSAELASSNSSSSSGRLLLSKITQETQRRRLALEILILQQRLRKLRTDVPCQSRQGVHMNNSTFESHSTSLRRQYD